METRLKASIVFKKNWDAYSSGNYRYIINEGGSRSTKTTSLIQIYTLISLQSQTPLRNTIWRAKKTWNLASVYKDYEKYLIVNSLYSEKDHNKSSHSFKFNKSVVECHGADNTQKLHGLTQDNAWINEAIEITKDEFDQIDQRTSGVIFIDYNPSEEEHWVYDLAKQPNSVFIKSTMMDNPFLAKGIMDKILSYNPNNPVNVHRKTANQYKWDVYGLGKRAKREGVIFNYTLIKEWDDDAEFIGNSLDFGFYPDPCASVRVGLLNGKLILKTIFYEYNLIYTKSVNNPDYPSIEQRFEENNVKKNEIIIADSAQKAGIQELRLERWNIRGVKKYPGSIIDGLNLMKNYMPFYVTEDSLELITELNNYCYSKDERSGKFTNEPIDGFNHLIDGIRYVCMELLHKPKIKLLNSSIY